MPNAVYPLGRGGYPVGGMGASGLGAPRHSGGAVGNRGDQPAVAAYSQVPVERTGTMTESEATLWDGPLQAEILLLAELIAAATMSGVPLCQEEIDQALGIEPPRFPLREVS